MAQSFFIWNGMDCRAMGVSMRGPAAIIRPEERVQHVQIPGRSGDLTVIEGENIYNSYIQTASIVVTGGYRVRDVYQWLRGSGYVTFSGEPDKRQQARIIGAITLNRISRNLDKWAGEVQFYCQPLKELLMADTAILSASGNTIWNYGDVISRPMWKVNIASGQTSITLASCGKSIIVTGLTGGTVIWIDSGTMEVWNSGKTALLTKDSTGDFPVLAPGANTVTGSGWTTVEIDKRERYL